MKSTTKMILIKQDRIQWQPFFMRKGGDFAKWKLLPGYIPAHAGHVKFRKPKIACLFRVETEDKHMKKAVR